MKKPSRVEGVAICGIGFISIGIIIITIWAIDPLWEVNQWIQTPTCNDLMVCTPKQIVHLVGKDEDGNVASEISGTIEFQSRGQFAMNKPIYYIIKLQSTHPEVIKEINFIISNTNEDLSSRVDNPKKFFHDMKESNRLIDMKKISENRYYRTGFWTINAPVEQVFAIFVVSPNDSVDLAGTSAKLFNLVSPEVKTQDDANIESRIANKTILGLTWMGIGLGFVLLGADFIARVVLRD